MNLKVFIKNISILSFMGIIVRIIGLIYRIPLTNMIGAEGIGYYGSAYNLYTMILVFSSTSIPMVVSNLLSNHWWKEEEKESVFKIIQKYVCIIGLLGTCFCYFFASFLTIGNPNATPVLKILAPTIFCSCCMGALRGYFQSKKNVTPTAISQGIEQIINAIFSIGMACFFMYYFSGNKAVLGAMGGAFGTFMGCFAGWIYLGILKKKQPKQKKLVNLESKDILKKLLSILIPFIGCTFIYNISGTIDMTLFYNILKTKNISYQELSIQYGIYSGQYLVLFHIPTAFAASISVALMPMLTRLKKKNEQKNMIQQTIFICFSLILPIMMGFYLVGDKILMVLFPKVEGLSLAISFLRIGTFAILPTCFATISTTILQSLNWKKKPFIHTFIALIIQTSINILFFYFTDFNIYVFFISSLGFSSMVCILNFISIKKIVGKGFLKGTYSISFLSCIMMSICFFIIYYLLKLFYLPLWLNVSLFILFSCISYGMSFYLLIKKKQQKRLQLF